MKTKMSRIISMAAILSCFITIVFFQIASADIYILKPKHDEGTNTSYNVSVNSYTPDINYYGTGLGVMTAENQFVYSYFQYDLSPVVNLGKVTSIILFLSTGAGSNYYGPVQLDVHYVSNNAWEPRTVTWNTRPDWSVSLGQFTYDQSFGGVAVWNLELSHRELKKMDKGDNLLSLAVVQPNATGTGIDLGTSYLIITTKKDAREH